jgi:hypothetical protein
VTNLRFRLKNPYLLGFFFFLERKRKDSNPLPWD